MNCVKKAVNFHRPFFTSLHEFTQENWRCFQQTIKVCVVKLSGKIEMYLSNALHSLTKVSG